MRWLTITEGNDCSDYLQRRRKLQQGLRTMNFFWSDSVHLEDFGHVTESCPACSLEWFNRLKPRDAKK